MYDSLYYTKNYSILIDWRIFSCIFSYLSLIFILIPYNTLKLQKYCILKKIGFKIQPERFLNFFLIFGEKLSLVSYKLVSYKKKRVYRMTRFYTFSMIQRYLDSSQCPQFLAMISSTLWTINFPFDSMPSIFFTHSYRNELIRDAVTFLQRRIPA